MTDEITNDNVKFIQVNERVPVSDRLPCRLIEALCYAREESTKKGGRLGGTINLFDTRAQAE